MGLLKVVVSSSSVPAVTAAVLLLLVLLLLAPARLRGIISLDMSVGDDDGMPTSQHDSERRVAIHWMPLIESMEQNVGNIGKMLLVAGQSECFQKYAHAVWYTWKLKRGRETLLRHKDDGDMRCDHRIVLLLRAHCGRRRCCCC
ncbi:hypothetical protein PTSG_11209 [Salpingoeca rosetta]|uniref:Uncharacterized protein n=1 Tax=Salpingoeca rosetta (strain ATCC 50818 / BSB-021) TaxID=946362 RepID=F2USR0_SALR5|nr:uncharacterized protein PTSG_11209 [Salpingoeca rosetta]EGD81169.1 hypothetical protein PTSG_11209 [Salpingoeca rosetta]|eukprot:XP_004987854.1 hypothetical protein PTSG_11209 [Salpingoeca rosetta]